MKKSILTRGAPCRIQGNHYSTDRCEFLHSGLIFGRVGTPIMDVVATVWFLSLLSGLSLAALGRSLHKQSRREKEAELELVQAAVPSRKMSA